ncbi:inhibitor of Bruton tyrosine kinase [Nilaparvata lugens]|uniref:inhibitor of Bruton tyrosine kinase n=1 Tax=Nilaparvata lugens TaxID=108931 RepID=UPI00193E953B|nr:inhibitor of Bruton tyrosine kinase [Nilaparvata lugens]
MPQGNHLLPKPDCTNACQSLIHGSTINAVITKRAVTDKQLASYISSLCCNFSRVRDETGRTALHMAASCGRLGLCRWLVKYCQADLNARDKENAATPLHRSIFYGQIHVAVFLIKVGASTSLFDEDDLLCFDVVNSGRVVGPGGGGSGSGQAYVWGGNSNYTHGSGSQQARANPELVDYFRRNNIAISQICMDKFHTVFRSEEGRLWACGHGQGGRLGVDSEATFIIPQPMRMRSPPDPITFVAIGRDHTVLLTENGAVLTCGLNTHHQLGHSPPPAKLLVPRPIHLRSLRVSNVIGVSAARFHSVFWTKDAVCTFGLHAGQLGHPNLEESKELTVIVPRVVPCLDKDVTVKCAAASDGATVVVGERGLINIIYVLHRYQTKRLVSKLSIERVCVVGGTLNARSDTKSLIEQGGETLKLLTLTSDGKIHVWQETSTQLEQCTFNLQRRLIIKDVCLSRNIILFSTDDGNGFIGNFTTNNKLKGSDTPYIEIQRLPHLHRTTSITCDPKGRNFAAVQIHPRSLITPQVSERELSHDLASLLVDASETDSLHDITFEVGGERFPAHKYILSLNSSLGEKNECLKEHGSVAKVDNVHPLIFHQLLLFIYSGDCDLIHPGPCRIKIMNNAKREDPIRLLAAAATEFKVHALNKILHLLRYDGNKILMKEGFSDLKKSKPFALDYNARKDLYDVVIAGNDGGTIQAHKCVLAARLEYFRHMLCGGWVEASVSSPLSLPFSTAILTDLISFLYSDSESSLSTLMIWSMCAENNVLIVADELLVTRLKEMCEMSLSVCLNLRNAGLLLQFSSTYNALQLHKCCMSFIASNLAAVLEMRTLDIVSLDELNSLSEYVRSTVASLANHVITPFTDAPKDEEVISASEKFTVPWDEEDEYSSINDLGWESEWLKNYVPGLQQAGKSFVASTPVAAKKKQRTPKLSTNEAQRRRYESVGSIRDLEKTLESPLSRSLNDNPEPLKENESSPGVERLLKNHVIAQLEDDDFDPSLFIKLPGSASGLSRNRKNSSGDTLDDKSFPSLTESLSDTSSFPELSEQLSSLKITPKKKSSSSNVKRSAPVKLSQKQQKKLALAESMSPGKSEVANSASPPTFAWANVSSPPQATTSFTDILRETRNNNSSFPSTDRCSVTSSSPQATRGSPSLSDIVADELKQKENWSKMRSKPFHLTQIEDKAIEDLLAFYNAENVFDERITVQRVVRGTVAMPTWFKSKR